MTAVKKTLLSTRLNKIIVITTMILFFINSSIVNSSFGADHPEVYPDNIHNKNYHGPTILDNIDIPSYLGKTEKIYGGDKKIVFLITDAHCNYNAQLKIGEIIRYLKDRFGLNIVNLEGGKGKYDLSVFTSIGDAGLRGTVMRYFLKNGTLTGAEYMAALYPGEYYLWGVEDPDLYDESLNAYRKSLVNRKYFDAVISGIKKELEKGKRKIFNASLLELDSINLESSAKGKDFKETIAYFIGMINKYGIDISGFTEINKVIDLEDKEKNIDFKKANSEADALVVLYREKAPEVLKRDLAELLLKVKDNRIAEFEFYGTILRLAEIIGIDTSPCANLKGYVEYLREFNSLDKVLFIRQLENVRDELKNAMFEDDIQRKLEETSKKLDNLIKKTDFLLSRDEYDEYGKTSVIEALEDMKSTIDILLPDNNVDALFPEKLSEFDENVRSFYELSFIRDRHFVDEIVFDSFEPAGGYNEVDAAIVVTGGFHEDNLSRLLIGGKISCVVITPDFRNENNIVNNYFSLLSGRKSEIGSFIEKVITSPEKISMLAIKHLFSEMGVDTRDGNMLKMEAEVIRHFYDYNTKGLSVPPFFIKTDWGYVVFTFQKEPMYGRSGAFELQGEIPFSANIFTNEDIANLPDAETFFRDGNVYESRGLEIENSGDYSYKKIGGWVDSVGESVGYDKISADNYEKMFKAFKDLFKDDGKTLYEFGMFLDNVNVWRRGFNSIRGYAKSETGRDIAVFLNPDLFAESENKYSPLVTLFAEIGMLSGMPYDKKLELYGEFKKLRDSDITEEAFRETLVRYYRSFSDRLKERSYEVKEKRPDIYSGELEPVSPEGVSSERLSFLSGKTPNDKSGFSESLLKSIISHASKFTRYYEEAFNDSFKGERYKDPFFMVNVMDNLRRDAEKLLARIGRAEKDTAEIDGIYNETLEIYRLFIMVIDAESWLAPVIDSSPNRIALRGFFQVIKGELGSYARVGITPSELNMPMKKLFREDNNKIKASVYANYDNTLYTFLQSAFMLHKKSSEVIVFKDIFLDKIPDGERLWEKMVRNRWIKPIDGKEAVLKASDKKLREGLKGVTPDENRQIVDFLRGAYKVVFVSENVKKNTKDYGIIEKCSEIYGFGIKIIDETTDNIRPADIVVADESDIDMLPGIFTSYRARSNASLIILAKGKLKFEDSDTQWLKNHKKLLVVHGFDGVLPGNFPGGFFNPCCVTFSQGVAKKRLDQFGSHLAPFSVWEQYFLLFDVWKEGSLENAEKENINDNSYTVSENRVGKLIVKYNGLLKAADSLEDNLKDDKRSLDIFNELRSRIRKNLSYLTDTKFRGPPFIAVELEWRVLAKVLAGLKAQQLSREKGSIIEREEKDMEKRIIGAIDGTMVDTGYDHGTILFRSGMFSLKCVLSHILDRTGGKILCFDENYHEELLLMEREWDIVYPGKNENASGRVIRQDGAVIQSGKDTERLKEQIKNGEVSGMVLDCVVNNAPVSTPNRSRRVYGVNDVDFIIDMLIGLSKRDTDGILKLDSPFYLAIDSTLLGSNFQLAKYLKGKELPENLNIIEYSSLQKFYQDGEEMTIGGRITVTSASVDEEVEYIRRLRDAMGIDMDYMGKIYYDMLVRSMGTEASRMLVDRMELIQENSFKMATSLQEELTNFNEETGFDIPFTIGYPSLPEHPEYDIAERNYMFSYDEGTDLFTEDAKKGIGPFVLFKLGGDEEKLFYQNALLMRQFLRIFRQELKDKGIISYERTSYGFKNISFEAWRVGHERQEEWIRITGGEESVYQQEKIQVAIRSALENMKTDFAAYALLNASKADDVSVPVREVFDSMKEVLSIGEQKEAVSKYMYELWNSKTMEYDFSDKEGIYKYRSDLRFAGREDLKMFLLNNKFTETFSVEADDLIEDALRYGWSREVGLEEYRAGQKEAESVIWEERSSLVTDEKNAPLAVVVLDKSMWYFGEGSIAKINREVEKEFSGKNFGDPRVKYVSIEEALEIANKVERGLDAERNIANTFFFIDKRVVSSDRDFQQKYDQIKEKAFIWNLDMGEGNVCSISTSGFIMFSLRFGLLLERALSSKDARDFLVNKENKEIYIDPFAELFIELLGGSYYMRLKKEDIVNREIRDLILSLEGGDLLKDWSGKITLILPEIKAETEEIREIIETQRAVLMAA